MTVVADTPIRACRKAPIMKYEALAPRDMKDIGPDELAGLASWVSTGLGGRQVACTREKPDSRILTYITIGPLGSGQLCLAVQMAVRDYPCDKP